MGHHLAACISIWCRIGPHQPRTQNPDRLPVAGVFCALRAVPWVEDVVSDFTRFTGASALGTATSAGRAHAAHGDCPVGSLDGWRQPRSLAGNVFGSNSSLCSTGSMKFNVRHWFAFGTSFIFPYIGNSHPN